MAHTVRSNVRLTFGVYSFRERTPRLGYMGALLSQLYTVARHVCSRNVELF